MIIENQHQIAAISTFLITGLLAIFVLAKGVRRAVTRMFGIYTVAISAWSFCWYKMISSHAYAQSLFWARFLHVPASFIPATFLHFVQYLLNIQEDRKQTILRRIFYGLGALFLVLCLLKPFSANVVEKLGFRYYLEPGPYYLSFLIFFIAAIATIDYLLFTAFKNSIGSKKIQIAYVLPAYVLGYAGGAAVFLPVYHVPIPSIALYTIPLCHLIIAYAILHHQLLDLRLLLREAALNVFTGGLLAGTTLVIALPLVAFQPIAAVIAGVIIMALLMALAYQPVRKAIQPTIDRIMFSNRFGYLEELGQLPNDMLEFTNLREMLKFLVTRLTDAAKLERVRIFMYDPGHQSYVETMFHSAIEDNGHLQSNEEPRDLSENSELVELLRRNKQLLIEDDMTRTATDKAVSLTELKSLGGEACFPVMKERDLLGLVVLGPKRSGEPFNQQDLKILQALRMRLENFLGQAMVITQEALNMVKDSHDMKNDVNALKGRITWRAMRIAGWKMDFEKQTKEMEGEKDAERIKAALASFRSKALEWFQEAERSRSIEDQAVARLAHRLRNWAEYGRVISEGFRGSRAMEAIEVGEAAKISVERWRPHAEKKNLALTVQAAPHLVVWGERSLVEQVIENLIDNAIKATKEGKVEVSCRADRAGILLEVRDSGCGIPAEDLATIFEKPFYQGRGRENLEQSTGVGLYLVAQYVRSLNGRVWAESTVGQGSAFFVELPKYNQERQGAAA